MSDTTAPDPVPAAPATADDAPALDDLRAQLEGFVAVARAGADTPGAPVPACPGWTLERLVGHLGRVQRWVVTQLPGAADGDVPPAPAWPERLTWFEQGAHALADALATTDLDAPTETWAGTRPARFWLRRMVHETLVHRADASQALVQSSDPLWVRDLAPPRVGIDGVDELFDVMVPYRFDRDGFGAPGSLHLHATDDDLPAGSGEWLVTVDADAVAVEHRHAKGDVAVRGPAVLLDLVLWGRVGVDDPRVEVLGDADVLARWVAASQF